MTSFVRFSHKCRSYRTFKSRGIIRGPVTVLFKYSVLNTGSSEFHQIKAMSRSDFTLAVLHSFSKSEICAQKLLADTAEVSIAQYIFLNTQTLLPFLNSFVGICLILWVFTSLPYILFFRVLHVSVAPFLPPATPSQLLQSPLPKTFTSE